MQKIKLLDICEIKYGKDHKKLKEGKVPVYGSGGIMRYVDDYLLDDESILIPRKGTLTNLFYVSGKVWTVDTLFWTIIDKKLCLPKYLYYFLLTLDIASMNVGSAVPSLTVQRLNGIEVPLPSMNEQKRIAKILSDLDNKIETNLKIIETLEEIAQTIFNEWFVEYNFPDENGKPYKFYGGKIIEREIGKIPFQWEVGNFKNIATIVGGGTPSKSVDNYYLDGDIPWLTPKDLSLNRNVFISKGNTMITNEGYKNSSAKIMPEGTILFSSRAPIGYIGIAKNEICTNQGFKSFIPHSQVSSLYMFCLVKHLTSTIENYATGSTFKEISSSSLGKIKIILPPAEITKSFSNAVLGSFKKIQALEEEVNILQNIKNRLLPELMSEKI